MMRSAILLAATAFALGAAQAAPPTIPVADYAKPLAFPKENKADAARHFNAARKLAGDDLFVDFAHRCILDARYKQRTQGEQYNGIVEPFAAFDELYSVGQMAVSAWALKTRDGIVLFDALNNADEAREIIVPNLQRLGLDPRDVKYVVITHSHGDHYGGAAYFQTTFGSRVIASAADWDEMESPERIKVTGWGGPPRRDIAVADGQTMTIGGAPIRFFVTPGHTRGTLSTIFPVHDGGKLHMVGFYGGLGLPWTPELRAAQVHSIARWVPIAQAARVDSQIGNHPLHYEALERLEIFRYREPEQSNPFVIGADRYRRYMQLQSECVRLWIARNGESQP
jgi:metallo-beta-lactamase class B